MVESLIVKLIHFLKSSPSVDQTFTNPTHRLKPLTSDNLSKISLYF